MHPRNHWSPDDPRWPLVWDMMKRDVCYQIGRQWSANRLSKELGVGRRPLARCQAGDPPELMPRRLAATYKYWLDYGTEHMDKARRLSYLHLLDNYGATDGQIVQARLMWKNIKAQMVPLTERGEHHGNTTTTQGRETGSGRDHRQKEIPATA